MEQCRQMLANCQSGKEVVERIWTLNKELQLKCFILLCKWWAARNKANAGERIPSVRETCRQVMALYQEFKTHLSKRNTSTTRQTRTWEPPPTGIYKLNTDAAFCQATQDGGWGYVIRNESGEFLDGGFGKLERLSSPLHAEAMAVRLAIERTASLGIPNIIVETDSANLGSALTSEVMDRSVHGCLFRQIKYVLTSQFDHFAVTVCPRNCNRVANMMASYSVHVPASGSVFMSQAPDFVLPLVSGDLPRANV